MLTLRNWLSGARLTQLCVLLALSALLEGCVGLAAPPSAPTVVFSATPTTIIAGQSTALTWTSTNAASATVDNGVGAVSTIGSMNVSPTQDTVYTITVTGPGGTATAQVAIIVKSATSVTIVANPTAIYSGQSSLLTVIATVATQVEITDNVDSNTYKLSPSGGTQSVTPTATTIYTATATASNGQTFSATATVTVNPPIVTIVANPGTIYSGQSTLLTVTAAGAAQVVITDNIDKNSYPLSPTGGAQSVSPTATVIYTATATASNGQTASAMVTVTVNPPPTFQQSVNHIVFMMQENHTFDNYFGMLNPYRASNNWNIGDDGKTYNVDGIDDKLSTISNVNDEGQSFSLFKLKSTCIDDDSSAWLQSFGDVSRFDFTPARPIVMDGFVHVAENYAKQQSGAGAFTDTLGERAMGYYDQTDLNYYYYMASQFALSDRWFSPVASESIPNRIATMTGGTTQGLVHDPGSNEDNLGVLLTIPTIFQELDSAKASWKIYYTTTQDQCLAENDGDCGVSTLTYPKFPATTFTYFKYSTTYLYENPSSGPCTPPTQNSGPAVGDPKNNFCIDTTHVAPITQYFTDVQNATLPSFAWIEPGYSHNDEHPGSGQSILLGQAQVASILNAFMGSPSYKDSIFFWSYDEGGGPYDHVPPVPTHTSDFTDASLGVTTDISSIAVNPDQYNPCLPAGSLPTLHCDLKPADPGANPADAAAIHGFAAQLGFRLPNIIVSPFTRKHYVSHIPMDHTAVIKLVETRFIGVAAHLTARDNSQPDLMDFFDFTNVPWATPPTPPQPVQPGSSADVCNAANMGP